MDINNTKNGIKKNKKIYGYGGGYNGAEIIRPLHSKLTFNGQYPLDNSYHYPSKIHKPQSL